MTNPAEIETRITPATWQDKAANIDRTSTGLLNLVGWFGSTHGSAMWRKAPEFLAVFQKEKVVGFDPQIDKWDASFVKVEAEVLANASTIIIRLENHELLNGSLGSVAEIGMAFISAALRGQRVIVSIEEGLLTSLNEPGAIAQYMMLETSLEKVETISELAGVLQIHRGNNLEDLAVMACETAKRQMQACQTGLDFHDFLLKRARRRQNYPRRVLLGGSGGPYTEAHEEIFRKKRQLLASAYSAEGQPVKILSEGAIAEAWKIPYGSVDNIGVALATRTLLAIENEFKREADLLLLPIMTEAASKAAVTEIGFLLLHALITGQDVKIYLEPFDPVDYLYHQLDDVDLLSCTDEKRMRAALRQAGVAAAILATATKEEIFDTIEIFHLLMQANKPAFNQVKKSLLGQTEVWLNADNIRRVRTLVQAHLESLDSDERFQGFFSYSTYIVV